MNNTDFNTELKLRRAALIEQYARLRRIAAILIQRGSVRFDKDQHSYYMRTGDYFRGSIKDRMAAMKLMELQKLIRDQAVRLLDLERII